MTLQKRQRNSFDLSISGMTRYFLLSHNIFWCTAVWQYLSRHERGMGLHCVSILKVALYWKKSLANVTSYQRYGTDSVESANSVLQLRTWEPTQKIADSANTAHEHVNVHPRLQTRWDQNKVREISESQIRYVTPTDVSDLSCGGTPHIIHLCK